MPRDVCGRCRRPTRVCYCAALPRLDTTTRVVFLQHPRERDMPIGTAHMARLCLSNAEIHVGVRWDDHAPVVRALGDAARPPILLYPGPGARDILREPPAGPVTLVVVDGTWSQARTVVRDNPILRALPRYAFTAPEPSHYRIRREPDDAYVSTIEAVMHVLGALEGDPARFRCLLDPLYAMVDAQLACQAASPGPRVRKPRPPRPPRLPAEVLERFGDLVCAVGEANAWPYQGGVSPHPDELVHWVAHRPGDGSTFEAMCAPTELSPTTPFHIEVEEARLRSAGSRAALLDGFARFLRPDDILCTWGHFGPDLYLASGGALPARLDLRAAAYRLTNQRIGDLDRYAATLGATPRPLGHGRAGRRLALCAQILHAWRARAADDVAA